MQCAEIGHGARTTIGGDVEQLHEDLRGRARIREGAMTWHARGSVEVSESGKACPLDPIAEKPPRKHHRVDEWARDAVAPHPGELLVEKRDVEPHVVPDDAPRRA